MYTTTSQIRHQPTVHERGLTTFSFHPALHFSSKILALDGRLTSLLPTTYFIERLLFAPLALGRLPRGSI